MPAHPRMYSDDDPHLAELRRVCLALPEATEVEAWGRPTFRAGKIFAMYGGGGDLGPGILVKPDPSERAALVADARFYVPKYWGPSGWLGLDITEGDVDWAEVAELVETSYRQVALKRMLAALDGSPTRRGR